MAKPKAEWRHWRDVFKEIRKSGVSLAEFCRRENLSYDACRLAFKKIEKARSASEISPRKASKGQWEAWRLEFLGGDYKSVADFLRSKGINRSSGYTSRMTKGWAKEKGEIGAKTQAENVAAIADLRGGEALAQLHGRILTTLYGCLADLEKNGPKRAALHEGIDSVRDNMDFLRGVSTAIDALLKVLPPISKIEAATATRALLQKVLDQGLDVTEASIQLEMMGVSIPETLRIMLSRQEPPEPEQGSNFIPDDEYLEQAYRAGIARIAEQQEKFVPERQRQVEEIKAECRDFDSFADNTVKE
jgi:hypothetical protein